MEKQGSAMLLPLIPEPSFETLLANERNRLIRFCAYMTGNPEAAEDLAQETLLEAWRNRQKFSVLDHGNEACGAKWLSAIARNVCLRWGRARGHDLAQF